MNDEQRANAVDELTSLVAQGSDNPYAVMNARAKVMEVLTCAVPEPDDDAVERAAKAIYECRPDFQKIWIDYKSRTTGYFPEPRMIEWEELGDIVKHHYRDMARAALQAADIDANWLDSLLAEADVSIVELWDNDADRQWRARATPRYGYIGPKSEWHNSPSEAVADAVRKAQKGQSDDTD